MVMKGHSSFPISKLQHHWNLTTRLFSVISSTLVGGGGGTPHSPKLSYSSAEKKSVYSTVPADWTILFMNHLSNLFQQLHFSFYKTEFCPCDYFQFLKIKTRLSGFHLRIVENMQ